MTERFTRGWIKKFLMALSLIVVVVSFVGCSITDRRNEIWNQINAIPKNENYVVVSNYEYNSVSKEANFQEITKEKIMSDGKKIAKKNTETKYYTFLTESNVVFSYRYNEKNEINQYALGFIAFDSLEVSVFYTESIAYDLRICFVDNDYICYKAFYLSSENGQSLDKTDFLILNKVTGEYITELNEDIAKGKYGKNLESPAYTDTYISDDIAYEIVSGGLKNKEVEDIEIIVQTPTYESVLQKNEILQEIDKIVGKESYKQVGYFVTNGRELFVVFESESNMMGKGFLNAVVFKCDLSFETFEYIGCCSTKVKGVLSL